MESNQISRLKEWDLKSIDSDKQVSIFDHLGVKPLLLFFFDINEEKCVSNSIPKVIKICLENPFLNVVGILTPSTPIKDFQYLQNQIHSCNFNFPVYYDKQLKTKERFNISQTPYWILSLKDGNIVTRQKGHSFQALNLLNDHILRATLLH